MSKLHDAVALLLAKYQLHCSAIASFDGDILHRIEAVQDPVCFEALSRDFYDASTIAALAEYLVGKILPQLSSSPWCFLKNNDDSGTSSRIIGISRQDLH